jgi:hypothetical protein
MTNLEPEEIVKLVGYTFWYFYNTPAPLILRAAYGPDVADSPVYYEEKLELLQKRGPGAFWHGLDLGNQERLARALKSYFKLQEMRDDEAAKNDRDANVG